MVTSTAGSRVLQDGVAVAGTVASGRALHYTYVAAPGASHVQLTLTGLAGSPVGYVSTTAPRPNASTAQFRVGSIYGNTLTLSAERCGEVEDGGGAEGECVFYITVAPFGAGSSAVFRIQGTSSSLTQLSLGSPGSGLASPDGYTVHLGQLGSFGAAPSLLKSLSYDPIKSFAPITRFAQVSQLVISHPSVPATTLKELIAHAKNPASRMNYGSGGVGTSGHLTLEMFKSATGVDILHVPFRGVGAALTAVISGEVQLAMLPIMLGGIQ
jgi:hypothetical protein